MLRVTALAMAILYAAPIFGGEPYNFPLKDGVVKPEVRAFQVPLMTGKIVIPAEPEKMTPAEVRALFLKGIEIATANTDKKPARVPLFQWRLEALATVYYIFLVPAVGAGDGDGNTFIDETAAPISRALASELVTSIPTDEVDAIKDNIRDYFAFGDILPSLVKNGIVRPEWGAYALLSNNGVGGGIDAQQWRVFLNAAGGEIAYPALAEAIFNSPIETVIWSPGPNGEMSWLSQYVLGYMQGFVDEPTFRNFLTRLRGRAASAQGLYLVRGQEVFAGLVNDWFVGTKDTPALISEFENMTPPKF